MPGHVLAEGYHPIIRPQVFTDRVLLTQGLLTPVVHEVQVPPLYPGELVDRNIGDSLMEFATQEVASGNFLARIASETKTGFRNFNQRIPRSSASGLQLDTMFA